MISTSSFTLNNFLVDFQTLVIILADISKSTDINEPQIQTLEIVSFVPPYATTATSVVIPTTKAI